MRVKKQIILIITIILVLNLTILATSTREEKKHNPFERFGLDYPEQEEIRTQHAQIRTTSQQAQEEIKVIITLKEPEQIPIWRNQLRTFNEETKKELKDTMREYIIEKTNEENTRFKYRSFNGFSTTITQQEYEELLNNNLIERVNIDKPVQLFMQDTVEIINASNVWKKQIKNMNLTGKGQTVCVIDTGIDYTHPDLGGCTEGEFLSGNCEKVIEGYDFYYDDPNPLDTRGHGTHVAGTVAANGDIKGVAPQAKLIAVNVFSEGGSSSDSYIIAGIDYCTGLPEEYNVSIITMSLGAPCFIEGFPTGWCYSNYCDEDEENYADAINYAFSKNISVIIATGNDGETNQISPPSCIRNATRVGSTTKNDAMSLFSNRWSHDIILAPGGTSGGVASCDPFNPASNRICSTDISNSYSGRSGTSMATPHVAGAIAVLNQFLSSLNSSKTPYELNELLKETGKTIEADSRIYSRIDLLAAYEVLEKEYFNISLELNVSEQVIELFNDLVIVSWNASSKEDFNSSLFIYNPFNDMIFYSNDSYGNMNLYSSSDSSSKLNWSGRYEIVFNASNNFFNKTTSKNFFVKKHPVYELKVDDSSQGIIHNVSGDVIHGYFGEYNVSVLVVDAELDNISLYFDNLPISFENAEYLFITDPGLYLLEANHSETEHYFSGSTFKYLNISDFPSIVIDGFEPNTPVLLEKNEVKTFSVINASSEDGKQLNYSWKFFNETILETNNSAYFVLNASKYLPGDYELEINITNNFNKLTHTWNITILPNFYLLLLNELQNKTLNIKKNLTINTSKNFNYGEGKFSVNITNKDLNYSINEDIITIYGSTTPGIYNTKINASINLSGNTIFKESNLFQITVSEVTFENNIKNLSLYSVKGVSLNLSKYFLFENFPNFNLTNQYLEFKTNSSTQEIIIERRPIGNYSTKINASLGASFAESNNFTIFVIDPFLNFFNNIPDKSFEEGEGATINLSNHFSFGGVNKEFNLTNSALTYKTNNNKIIIESDTPGTYKTKINATIDYLNELSNEFKVTVKEKQTSTTSTGTDPSPPSIPPPSTPVPEQDKTETEQKTENITKTNTIRPSKDSFFNVTIEIKETHKKFKDKTYKTFTIQTSGNITNVSLEFEVNNTWIEKEKLDPKNIALFYYKEKWKDAPTEILSSNENVTTYHSVTEVSNYYLIGEKKQKEIEMKIEETTQTIPPREEIPKDKENNNNIIMIILSAVIVGLTAMITIELKKIKK